MLHQIQIRKGAATYSNTYIRTPRFLAEEAVGAKSIPVYGRDRRGRASLDGWPHRAEEAQGWF